MVRISIKLEYYFLERIRNSLIPFFLPLFPVLLTPLFRFSLRSDQYANDSTGLIIEGRSSDRFQDE